MQSRAVLATLLLSALLAGCTGKSAGYPEGYLLAADELPAGLKLSEVPEDMPVTGNPAQVPAELLSAVGPEFEGFVPDQVWIELLENTTSTNEHGPDGGLMILAGFWSDEDKAKAALAEIRSQSDDEVCAGDEAGALLRDGNVVVIVGGDDAMAGWVPRIVSELEKKSPGLEDIC